MSFYISQNTSDQEEELALFCINYPIQTDQTELIRN